MGEGSWQQEEAVAQKEMVFVLGKWRSVGAGMVRRKAMVGREHVCLEEQEEGHCDWTTEDGGPGAVW